MSIHLFLMPVGSVKLCLMMMLYFRLKEQDEVFMNQKKEYEREINHLRLLLQEKEHNLYDIATEKR